MNIVRGPAGKLPVAAVIGSLLLGLLFVPVAIAAPAGAGPTIEFNMVGNGDSIQGNSADLMALIGGADLMATTSGIVLDGTAIGRAPVPGRGYWQALIDGKPAGLSICDTLAVPNDTMPQISAGSHTVQYVLLSNDAKQLAATPSITVKFANAMNYAPAPGPAGIKITKVTSPDPNFQGRFEVRTQVSGFKLSGADVGKATIVGEGHWNVSIDGKYAGMSVSQMVAIPNDSPGAQHLAPGPHTLKVELVNNDDTPVVGADAATATVIVPGAVATAPAPAPVPAALPKTGDPLGAFNLAIVALASSLLVALGLALRRRRARLIPSPSSH